MLQDRRGTGVPHEQNIYFVPSKVLIAERSSLEVWDERSDPRKRRGLGTVVWAFR